LEQLLLFGKFDLLFRGQGLAVFVHIGFDQLKLSFQYSFVGFGIAWSRRHSGDMILDILDPS
jgi:hypothetical protein